jgi:hypothetical protein
MTTSERFFNSLLAFAVIGLMVMVPFSCLIAAAVLRLTERSAAAHAATPLAGVPGLA